MDSSITKSSGNVFADMGIKTPEEALAKAKLAREINLIINRKNLNQTEAAKLLRTTQPKISNIMRGKLSSFSIEKLFHYLILLGNDIEINIKPHDISDQRTPAIIVHDFALA